jgi:hypothetical protein
MAAPGGEQHGQRYKHYKVRDTAKDTPALKRRAMGRIEHTLLDGACRRHPNRPKTFARNPPSTTLYHKMYQMFLSKIKGRSQID